MLSNWQGEHLWFFYKVNRVPNPGLNHKHILPAGQVSHRISLLFGTYLQDEIGLPTSICRGPLESHQFHSSTNTWVRLFNAHEAELPDCSSAGLCSSAFARNPRKCWLGFFARIKEKTYTHKKRKEACSPSKQTKKNPIATPPSFSCSRQLEIPRSQEPRLALPRTYPACSVACIFGLQDKDTYPTQPRRRGPIPSLLPYSCTMTTVASRTEECTILTIALVSRQGMDKICLE